MRCDPTRVVVSGTEPAVGRPIAVTRVHHRDFPELCAEGGTAVESAASLARHMAHALDWTCEGWRRDWLREALSDVDAFLRLQDPRLN